MNQVISMHGWCYDSTFWKNWEKHFQSYGWIWKNSERGYGSFKAKSPTWESNIEKTKSQKKVILCHSLGVHLVPCKTLKEASDIVLLNSFSRFIPNGQNSRAIMTALNGMKKHLGKPTENKMLLKFLQKANEPYKMDSFVQESLLQGISSKGRKRLIEDLNLLINTQKLPNALSKNARVLVVQGKEDKIVSSITTTQLISDLRAYMNQAPTQWFIKGEGHVIHLPAIIKKVSNWLEVTK